MKKLASVISFDQRKHVNNKDTRELPCSQVEEAFEEFQQYVGYVQEQYTETCMLKENLPANCVITQMDFAQNFLCQPLEEV